MYRLIVALRMSATSFIHSFTHSLIHSIHSFHSYKNPFFFQGVLIIIRTRGGKGGPGGFNLIGICAEIITIW